MPFGDILVPILLAGVVIYSGRSLVLGLRSGRMSFFGGILYDRTRRPAQFWQAFALEMAMFAALSALLAWQIVKP